MEDEDVHETLVLTIRYTMYSLTIASLIYGVISWRVIKKFRNYRNYVCLNAILANLLYVALYKNSDDFLSLITANSERKTFVSWLLAMTITTDYLAAVKHHWLIVLCHMFYVDIVKVFNGHIQRRYLKSSLFGWGAPFIVIGLHVSVGFVLLKFNVRTYDWPISYIILMLPLLLNILLYIVIVFSLFRGSNASLSTTSTSATNKWRRLYIATLIIILGDVALLSTYIIVFVKQGLTLFILILAKKRLLKDLAVQFIFRWSPNYTMKSLVRDGILYTYLELLNHCINPIALAVFLVIVKSNREMWYKFYVSRLKQRLSARHLDIQIHGRVIREPAETRPARASRGANYR